MEVKVKQMPPKPFSDRAKKMSPERAAEMRNIWIISFVSNKNSKKVQELLYLKVKAFPGGDMM